MTPQRIQLSRKKGWRKPENTVVVARPSILGNPFIVTKGATKVPTWSVDYIPNPLVDSGYAGFVDDFDTKLEAIQCAVDTYREWATTGGNHYYRVIYFVESKRLAGKNLACWCPLEDAAGSRVPCHADVLLELANR